MTVVGRIVQWNWLAIVSLTLLAIAAAPAARAQAPSEPFDSRTLTGDWGGERTQLFNQGIDLEGGYVSEIANNPHGGTSEETRYTDQFALTAKFDLQPLARIDHAWFEITISDRNGQNLSQDAQLHTLQQVQEVYGRGQTWRLSQFEYRETWWDGALDFKIGRMTLGEDFAAFSCDFQNLTFCGSQPGNIRGELWYNYPVSQWGTRIKLALNQRLSFQLGLYQTNPTYISDSWAQHDGLFPYNPPGTIGALIPAEVAWNPSTALPGTYKFGVWLDTANEAAVMPVNIHEMVLPGSVDATHPYGEYINFIQRISGTPDGRGTDLFLSISQSDRNTAASTDRQAFVGIQMKGLIAGRSDDSIGFAVGTTHINSRVAQDEYSLNAQTRSNSPVAGSEYATELYYSWSPLKYLVLRPNLQYVLHPGGISANPSVIVLGLKTIVTF